MKLTLVLVFMSLISLGSCKDSKTQTKTSDAEVTYLLLDELTSQYIELYNCPVDTVVDMDTLLLKLSVKDCRGELSFELINKQGVKKMTGQYANGLDTLKKYLVGKSAITGNRSRSILKYFQPIPSGNWFSFDNRATLDTIKFIDGFKVEE